MSHFPEESRVCKITIVQQSLIEYISIILISTFFWPSIIGECTAHLLDEAIKVIALQIGRNNFLT